MGFKTNFYSADSFPLVPALIGLNKETSTSIVLIFMKN